MHLDLSKILKIDRGERISMFIPAVQNQIHFGALRGEKVPGVGYRVSFVEKTDQGGQGFADDDVVIVSASRTPVGRNGGAFANVDATALAYVSAKSTLEKSGLNASEVDKSIWGNITPTSLGAPYLARTVAKLLGMVDGSTSYMVQRRCASGFSAIEEGAKDIAGGEADVALVGGVENMSRSPVSHFTLSGLLGKITGLLKKNQVTEEQANEQWKAALTPDGLKLPKDFETTLNGGLIDPFVKMVMFNTADKLAQEKGINRQELDALAAESHRRALQAQAEGRFNAEITPVTQQNLDELNTKLKSAHKLPNGVTSVAADEGPRATTPEALAGLRPLDSKNPNATHTAGSASQISDGAASLLLVKGSYAKAKGLKPLAKLRALANTGVRPDIMGYGPVPAIKEVLKADNKTAGQMDLVEINEAFAVVPKVAINELGFSPDKVNVNGSGISIGHPLSMTGARVITHLVHELQRQNKQFGLGSACIGGGEGAAMIIENLNYAKPEA
jgi:acetyl-CoA C-acetyltransferase